MQHQIKKRTALFCPLVGRESLAEIKGERESPTGAISQSSNQINERTEVQNNYGKRQQKKITPDCKYL